MAKIAVTNVKYPVAKLILPLPAMVVFDTALRLKARVTAAAFKDEVTSERAVLDFAQDSLINEPDILLLDEPLGALDAFTRMNMQDEILKVWQEKKQLAIMVTHDVDEAIYMGTRVIVMDAHPGRVVSDIRIDQAYPRERSSQTFVACRNEILNRLHFGGRNSGQR